MRGKRREGGGGGREETGEEWTLRRREKRRKPGWEGEEKRRGIGRGRGWGVIISPLALYAKRKEVGGKPVLS